MEEMTSAVDLGLFAGDIATALERTVNQGKVPESDRPTVQEGLHLLEALQGPRRRREKEAGPHRLAVGEAGLDVLDAIEEQAEETNVTEFLMSLAKGLRAALDGDVTGNEEQLKKLLRLFVAIGDAEVERVSCLAQPHSPSIPLWSPRPTTSRF